MRRSRISWPSALADPRIELIDNEGRKLAGAFNTGMRRADTEFVAILLGDDLWAPVAVEVLRRSLDEHPDADFFHSSRRVIDERGEALSSSTRAGRETCPPRTSSPPRPSSTCSAGGAEMALEIGGMDESLNSVGVDDFDFPWTMAERGARFQAIPDCLYLYRDHRESFRLTTHLPRSHHKREIARIMRKHGRREGADRRPPRRRRAGLPAPVPVRVAPAPLDQSAPRAGPAGRPAREVPMSAAPAQRLGRRPRPQRGGEHR